MSHIAIIIVNYRTAPLVVECLSSLMADQELLSMAEIVIVDNCSGDESLNVLQQAIERHGWAQWVHLIAAPENRGFGAGNNIAFQYLLHRDHPSPTHIMCVNPDTIVPVGAIRHLATTLDNNGQVGVVGSPLCDVRGTEQRAAHPFPAILAEVCDQIALSRVNRLLLPSCTPDEISPYVRCDWVSGAALMIRTTALRKVGLFDEQFFLYFEEVDLCRRVARAGYQVGLARAAAITHLEGGSTGNRDTLMSSPAWKASRRVYYRKHHGRTGLAAADAARFLGMAVALLLQPLRLWWRSRKAPPAKVPVSSPEMQPHPSGLGDRA